MQEQITVLQPPISKNRIQWIDILKIIGMFEIYLFHNLSPDSPPRSFFFVFFVEMFFLMSGFFSDRKKEESFLSFVWKKFKAIMIPYFSFAVLCEFVLLFNNEYNLHQLLADGKHYLFGIRTTLPAQTLWFLPCLFLISVIYRALLTVLRNKYIVFAAAFVISWLFPYSNPSWFWNLDSALKYLVFYALGHLAYSWIMNCRFKKLKLKGKLIYVAFVLAALCYAVFAYIDNIYFPFTFFNIQLPPTILNVYKMFAAVIIIFLHIQLALLLENIQILSRFGKYTLIFCGTETISNLLVTGFLSVFGVTVYLTSPLSAALFSVICMAFSWFAFVPLFDRYLPWALGKWKHTENKK